MKKNNFSIILKKLKNKSKSNSFNNRKIILKNLLSVLNKNKIELIDSIIKDTNKDKKESISEVKSSINILKFSISKLKNIKNKNYSKKSFKGKIIYEPLGLVALITPWNYPLLTIFERLPFILGAGNTAIIKPSEFNKKFTKCLIKIINKNKKFKDFIYVLPKTNKKIGKSLCYQKEVDMISFVGSVKVGKMIAEQSARDLKKTSLELGGKNPAIYDLSKYSEKIYNQIYDGIFENRGQCCVGISRILIKEIFFHKFKSSFLKFAEQKMLENKLKLYPLANKVHENKVKILIKKLVTNVDKKNLSVIKNSHNILHSMFIDNSTNKYNKILEKEFFFPIISLEKFKNKKDLISKVNSTKYGLACHFFTDNKKNFDYVNEFDYGRVWLNSSIKKWNPLLPVGGKKHSGKGFDMGENGFYNYLLQKSIFEQKY